MDHAHHQGGERDHRQHHERSIGLVGIVPDTHDRDGAGACHHRTRGKVCREAAGDLERITTRLRGHVRVCSVQQDLNRRCLAAGQVTLKALRDHQSDPGVAALQQIGRCCFLRGVSGGRERIRHKEALHESAARRAAVQVYNGERHVLDLEGERQGADDDLDGVEP